MYLSSVVTSSQVYQDIDAITDRFDSAKFFRYGFALCICLPYVLHYMFLYQHLDQYILW